MRADLGADAGALQAVDDHAVLRLQPLADHAQALVERPERHRLCLHRVVVLDHENDLARLVGRDRRIRQQQRFIGRAADQPDAAELSRQDRQILVRDDRAAAQRAGRDIQPVVEEIHLAVMRRLGLAGQRHLHRIRRIARTRPLALEPEPVVPQIGRLVDVEIDVDRIERDDRGQQRRAAVAALHEIAGADEMAADAAGDRRHHMGEFDVELAAFSAPSACISAACAACRVWRRWSTMEFGDRLGLVQGQRAIEFALGQFRLGARIGELAVGLLGDRLERARDRSHRADRRHGRRRRRETRRR